MFTWGEIRVGYYVVIAVLVLLFNGTASAVFLGILLALFFEQPFKLWVFKHVEVVEPVRAVRATASAAPAKPDPAPKKAAAKKPTKSKKAAAKPKPEDDDDFDA